MTNASGGAAQDPAQAMRVLVVDDNKDAAETLAEMLRFMGAESSVAHDGESALAEGAAHPPDLVLLDIGLPGMDGYETARRWRKAFGPRTRLAALTGYGSDEDKQRSHAAGFDMHLVKPVAVDVLQQLIAEGTAQLAA